MMKKTPVLVLLAALTIVLVLPALMNAQDGAALFKSKCAGCHGADGKGTAVGKRMGAQDLTSAEVQGMSDAQLSDIITGGKNKMPKFASLSPDEIKALVSYIRTLKQ